MNTNNNNESSTTAKTGLGIGIGALGLLLLQNGAFGNVLGGNRPTPPAPATQSDIVYERQLTTKDMEIAKLQAQIYTDDKVDALRRELQATTAAQREYNVANSAAVASINAQTATLMKMTGTIINAPAMLSSEAAASAFKAQVASAQNNG